jgi:hypothetical protein
VMLMVDQEPGVRGTLPAEAGVTVTAMQFGGVLLLGSAASHEVPAPSTSALEGCVRGVSVNGVALGADNSETVYGVGRCGADGCDASPCANGAQCVARATTTATATCLCRNMTSGPTCAEPADPCLLAPCANGATCSTGSNGTAVCLCVLGFYGATCEQGESVCHFLSILVKIIIISTMLIAAAAAVVVASP